jgi:hypothetical protein
MTVEEARQALIEHYDQQPFVEIGFRYKDNAAWRAYEEWNIELMRRINALRQAREMRSASTN